MKRGTYFRTIEVFLWLPRTVAGETRWLVRAKIRQEMDNLQNWHDMWWVG
jgi:hypothetical protein